MIVLHHAPNWRSVARRLRRVLSGLARWTALGASSLVLAGCLTAPRESPFEAQQAYPERSPFADVRIAADDPRVPGLFFETYEAAHRLAGGGPVNMLALSGGGANGAFGAGLLVGWSSSGLRPEFQVVTGVSTGALIAPFAFLGPSWDDRLARAFSGGDAQRYIKRSGVAALFYPGLYSGSGLESLVTSYVDDDLIAAVARESQRGRKLYIATTDLDVQKVIIWDMGRIASQDGPSGRDLFRAVLVASASVPGAFPPKMISTTVQGVSYQEMHVDGGMTKPFFIFPGYGATVGSKGPLRGISEGNVYVILNESVELATKATPINTLAIMKRSADTQQVLSGREAIRVASLFAHENGLNFYVGGLKSSAVVGLFQFDTASMKRLFDIGKDAGASADRFAAQ